ncbi:MAG TPA: hypothetical protein VF223_13810 [Trebonia sp.]
MRNPPPDLRRHPLFEQLAADAGYTLAWQRLDADRNIDASDAIMRGDPEPMRKMLDELIGKHQPASDWRV